MKFIIFLIALIQSTSILAQSKEISSPEKINAALQISMTDVCRIDRNSRQCELLQALFAQQNALTRGEDIKITTNFPPEVLENLLSVSRDRKSQLEKMELDKKIGLSRTYKALNSAKDRICNIDSTKQPCGSVLSFFIFQTDIEIGNEVNPAAQIPLETKQSVRNYISKENPELTESSQILAEALMIWHMHNNSPASKRSKNKSEGICADKYGVHYDAKKCQ